MSLSLQSLLSLDKIKLAKTIRHTFALAVLFTCVSWSSHVSAAVLINEFVASSDTLLADEDGDYSDWIELYNNGSAVNLQGWYLTDDASDLTQWTLPAITLAAGEYRVIFASSKDRTAPSSELHTNFKLGKGGEYLALIRPNGSTVESAYAPEYPAQFTDITYGQIAGGGVGFLQSATPGAVNSPRAIPGVLFSTPSGIFVGSKTITLSTDISLQAGDEIRYTLNGAEPTTASSLYSGSFNISNKRRIRARVFRGNSGGRTTSATYIEVSSSVASFNSNLPLVVVDTFNQSVSTDDVLYTRAAVAVIDRTNGRATITDVPDFSGLSGIRIRGSSSAGFAKKQYKLELWDDSENDLDHNLLGIGSESDWVLYAPGRYDRSMIANPLMYGLSTDIGSNSMQTQFIELYLNDGSGRVNDNDYDGLYILTESIKIGDERVDISKMSPSDVTVPAIAGGYIIARDRGDDDKHSFFTTHNENNNGVTDGRIVVHRPKIDDLNSSQINYIENYILDFEDALYGATPEDPTTGYRAYIDVPSWVDAHLLRLLAMDPDILRLSNFFYKPRDGKLINAPLWDFDRTLNSDDNRDDNPEQIWAGFSGVDPFEYGWWQALFNSPSFNGAHRTRWHALRENELSLPLLYARIDTLHAQITEAYPREDSRWGTRSDYGSRYTNLAGEIAALKNWLAQRVAFLDNTILSPSLTEPVGGNGGDAFVLSCLQTEVLVGIDGRAGSRLDLISPLCVEVDTFGLWTGNVQVRGEVGGNGGNAFNRRCPVNWAVSAFNARSGSTVDQLEMLCSPLNADLTVDAQTQALNSIGGNGGAANGPLTCINAQPANGVRGRAGNVIDQFGLSCGSPLPVSSDSTFSLSDLTVNESDGSVDVLITLSPASAQTKTVGVFTRAGDALGGSDFYGFTENPVTFAPGETTRTVPLTVLDDTLPELTETLQVLLFDAVGASIVQSSATVTILDNDATGVPLFSVSDVSVNEGQATASVVVSLSQALSSASSVSVFTRAQTAVGGEDYYGLTLVVDFAAGETSQTVDITILDDLSIEGDETFTVNLIDPVGAPLGQSTATVTVVDDDGAGQAALSLSDVSVIEGDAQVTLTLSLSSAQSQTISVGIHTRSATAFGGGIDFYGFTEQVSFAPGVTERLVVLQIADDSVSESTETLSLRLFNAVGAIIANHDGLATVTIVDDD